MRVAREHPLPFDQSKLEEDDMFHGVEPLSVAGAILGAVFALKISIIEVIDAIEAVKVRLAKYKASK
jgi:hypothetical protein